MSKKYCVVLGILLCLVNPNTYFLKYFFYQNITGTLFPQPHWAQCLGCRGHQRTLREGERQGEKCPGPHLAHSLAMGGGVSFTHASDPSPPSLSKITGCKSQAQYLIAVVELHLTMAISLACLTRAPAVG